MVTLTLDALDPEGVVTTSVEAEAEFTVALTPPKKTILSAGVLLKPEPFKVTEPPMAPLAGEIVVMTGCASAKAGSSNKQRKLKIRFFKKTCANMVRV